MASSREKESNFYVFVALKLSPADVGAALMSTQSVDTTNNNK